MNFYYYLFSCAYWCSVKDMKETLSPQEYGLIFISILNLLIFVILSGLLNLIIGHNILNPGFVIVVSVAIVIVNYLILIKDKKYLIITETFKRLGSTEFKGKRRTTLILAFVVTGLIAIIVSASQVKKG
jgi:hypothetical protein